MSLQVAAATPCPAAPPLRLAFGPQETTWPGGTPPGLPVERAWRRVSDVAGAALADGTAVVASRWTDGAPGRRHAAAEAPNDRHVLGVALCRTRIRLTLDRREIFDGIMPVGTVYLTGPSQPLEAEFHGPCDFLHLYMTEDCVAKRRETDGPGRTHHLNGAVVRDLLAGQLARTLIEDAHAGDPLYAESVARTLLLRLAALSAPRPAATSALPKWRLRRVQEHVEEHLDASISLADLAGTARLSRSYFAAQFRAATGRTPRDYVAERRIERAKGMLMDGSAPIVEVALEVGFQTQAYFTTVFKRLTGTTPARWRLVHLNLR